MARRHQIGLIGIAFLAVTITVAIAVAPPDFIQTPNAGTSSEMVPRQQGSAPSLIGSDRRLASEPTLGSQAPLSANDPRGHLDRWITIALDVDESDELRRIAAESLIAIATPESLGIIERLLTSDSISPQLAYQITIALGISGSPDAFDILESQSTGQGAAAIGALAALANDADDDARTRLLEILLDPTVTKELRILASHGLVSGTDDEAAVSLFAAYSEIEDEVLALVVLDDLGTLPLSQTEDWLRGLLENPETGFDTNRDVLSSLGTPSGNALEFLAEQARGAPDEGLRIAAIDSIGESVEAEVVTPLLASILDSEESGRVREALWQQLSADIEGVVAVLSVEAIESRAYAESDEDARIAALRTVAGIVGAGKSRTWQRMERFDSEAAPVFESVLRTDTAPHLQIVALEALAIARTETSIQIISDATRHSTLTVGEHASRLLARVELQPSSSAVR